MAAAGAWPIIVITIDSEDVVVVVAEGGARGSLIQAVT